MEEASVSKRKVFSQSDCDFLRDLVKKHASVIENKITNKVSTDRKKREWDSMAIKFNSRPGIMARTGPQLKKKWENMKDTAKKEFGEQRKSINKTGGGDEEMTVSSESEFVYTIIAPQIDPLNNDYDSDYLHPPVIHERESMAMIPFKTRTNESTCREQSIPQQQDIGSEVADDNTNKGESAKNKQRVMRVYESAVLELDKKEHKLKLDLNAAKINLVSEKLRMAQEIHLLKKDVLTSEKKYWEKKLQLLTD